MLNPKKIYYTAKNTGIRQSLQAWLETIADKDFGIEYCMMDVPQQFKVKRKFVERVRNGVMMQG